MQNENTLSMNTDDSNLNEKFSQSQSDNKLVRLIKSIVINDEPGKYIDESVIKFKYYNTFNYSFLSKEHENIHLAFGITGTRRGVGKTLVACNLAVSLALGSQKDTVLVDLNVSNPRLHQIFGVPQSPGLAEAFLDGQVHISRTAIDNLSVLTIGNFMPFKEESDVPFGVTENEFVQPVFKPSLGLNQLSAFRDVIFFGTGI